MLARSFALPVVVAAAAALAACGASASNQPTSAGAAGSANSTTGSAASAKPSKEAADASLPDPCGLLSTAEIKNVVGKTPAATETSNAGDSLSGPTCTWNDADGYSVVVLTVMSQPDAFKRSTVSSSTPVTGVGQDAHFGRLAALYVKTAAHAFWIQSRLPVADGRVGTEVRTAMASAGSSAKKDVDEASFRLAKLVTTRL